MKKETKITLTREEKLEKAKKMKENWNRREKKEEYNEKDEEETEIDEEIEEKIEEVELAMIAAELEEEESLTKIAKEAEEKVEKEITEGVEEIIENEIEIEDLLEMAGEEICGLCAHTPCLCLLLKVDLKLKMLRESQEIPKKTSTQNPPVPDNNEIHQTSNIPTNSDISQGLPDYNSLAMESAKGLPPVQVCLSEDNLYEGSLGEARRGGAVSSPTNPPNPTPLKTKKVGKLGV